MIAKKGQNNQLPSEIKVNFNELRILKHLGQAGIQKSFGFSSGYLFQLYFSPDLYPKKLVSFIGE
ncbi:hypothetical protein NBRC111894_4602 [Sporolactobacillus inulinus]|uniref:Uncharacterized protein n=1 Tax=Sporolactobacillus inulinus TaxID=2078 RepID=A0A4Y1ZKG4_9BACL|nr:hypothetical protein NBRC111894_4602 [Sporolactobacillus inulinus]